MDLNSGGASVSIPLPVDAATLSRSPDLVSMIIEERDCVGRKGLGLACDVRQGFQADSRRVRS